MSGKFTACLLTQGGDGVPRFTLNEIDLYPGRRMEVNDEDVLLAGGFSSLSPETGFPLSPTLQLNRDLGDYDSDQLQSIALAELERVNSAAYRSYLVEPDNRLCVLGSDGESLERFVNDFGGVVDIEPLLLKGYHPEIPVAVELDISGRTGAYELQFSVRSPVDEQKCTYCGACGPACPEDCLDANLNVDFSVCTSCKECEKVCPNDAIDIHGVEQRKLSVPAILLMDGVKIDYDGDNGGVYQENNIRDFLATLFAYQVDEVVSHNENLCQYSAKLGYGCTACADVCKFGAISRGPSGLHIDSVKCEECGGCIGVCPTGAIQYERFKDASFVSYIQSLDIEPGSSLVIGSEEMLHSLWWQAGNNKTAKTFFLEFNRVSGLSLFHLLFLFARGFGRIYLLTEDGHTASQAGLNQQTALAASLLNTYCGVENRIVVATPKEYMARMQEQQEPVLKELLTVDSRENRRVNLAEILSHFTSHTGRHARIKEHRSLPFATIACDENKCTQCYACLNDCRIQALHTDEEQLTLRYTSSLCVGCAVCVRVCPENALKISAGATVDEQFFKDSALAEAEPMRCKECGKVFGTKKSYERVMEILSQRESVDTSHFEYCDTCRVVKLFEGA